jgi:hypothetical protein
MTGYKGYCNYKGRSFSKVKKGGKSNEEMADYLDFYWRLFACGLRRWLYLLQHHLLTAAR